MEEFWLSWSSDTVQVGSGHQIGQDEFITLNDSVPTPKNYLAVSTGFGAPGYWILHSGKKVPSICKWHLSFKNKDDMTESLVKMLSTFSVISRTFTDNSN